MTFKIFSGDARKAIADHIIGSPPVIPNRHGSNHGTDLLVQGGTQKPPYDPTGGGGGYDPDPGHGYDPTGGGGVGTLPPTTGPGRAPITDCRGATAADNSGACPPGIQSNADGSKFQWIRKTDANGLAYCCPTALPVATDPQPPTTGAPPKVCPGANVDKFAAYDLAKSNTVSTLAPFNGKTPSQYQAEMKADCTAAGNSFNSIQFETQTGTSVMDACCEVTSGGTTLPRVYPPTVTPVIDPVPPIYDHDGETGGDTTPPDISKITCHGPVIQSIASGQKGYMVCGLNTVVISDDCTKRLSTGSESYTASSTSYPASCAEATTYQPLLIVKNPSSATIAAGTVVVAVRNNTHADSEGTILFVPCST